MAPCGASPAPYRCGRTVPGSIVCMARFTIESTGKARRRRPHSPSSRSLRSRACCVSYERERGATPGPARDNSIRRDISDNVESERFQSSVAIAGPLLNVTGIGVSAAPHASAASTIGGPITRSEIIARAQYWGDIQPGLSDQGGWPTGPDGDHDYRRVRWLKSRQVRNGFDILKPLVRRVRVRRLSRTLSVMASLHNSARSDRSVRRGSR